MKKIITEHYERVSYRTAIKLLNSGEDIYITPRLLNPESPWHYLFNINKDILTANDTTFDSFVKSVIWYNCNCQTGKYPAYYISRRTL